MASLNPVRVVVIGDFMLDVYTMGDVSRISPEAPVPVLKVKETSRRPGGAGNAILNLTSLGMDVVAVGRVGCDSAGEHLVSALEDEGVDCSGILEDRSTPTPLKNRIIAASQQLVRVDVEETLPLSQEDEAALIARLPTLFEGAAVIAISDYAKGFLTRPLLQAIFECAEVPVIVDPKGLDFTKYQGATILKPNLAEALAAAGLDHDATLERVAQTLIEKAHLESLIITRSSEGISVFRGEGDRSDHPAIVHAVTDVTGAGDTVLAVLTAALGNQLTLDEGAVMANAAASVAIERLGCARVTLEDIERRMPAHA